MKPVTEKVGQGEVKEIPAMARQPTEEWTKVTNRKREERGKKVNKQNLDTQKRGPLSRWTPKKFVDINCQKTTDTPTGTLACEEKVNPSSADLTKSQNTFSILQSHECDVLKVGTKVFTLADMFPPEDWGKLMGLLRITIQRPIFLSPLQKRLILALFPLTKIFPQFLPRLVQSLQKSP